LVILWVSGCTLLDPNSPGYLVPTTVDEDHSLPALSINTTRLHLETYGNPVNRTIVFLHGGPGGDYRGLLRLKSLADTYFLVFFDQRGSGLSRRHSEDAVSWKLYLDDLNTVINHFSPNAPVVIVGHSWGGMYATGFTAANPTRVSAVVLIDSGPLKASFDSYASIGLQATDSWANEMLWQSDILTPGDHVRADFQCP
jgi:proline iminopeptidase